MGKQKLAITATTDVHGSLGVTARADGTVFKTRVVTTEGPDGNWTRVLVVENLTGTAQEHVKRKRNKRDDVPVHEDDTGGLKLKKVALVNFFKALEADLDNLSSLNPAREYAFERQKVRARKRAALRQEGVDPKEVAIAGFIAANDYCGSRKLTLDEDIVNDARLFIATTLEKQCSREFDDALQESYRPEQLLSRWRFGPGKSRDCEATHTVEKFYSVWSCTKSAEPLVRYVRNSSCYLTAFDSRETSASSLLHVSGSQLRTVLKNQDTDRVIALEPLGNMVLQLAAGQIVTDALRGIGLDITTQQAKNKQLAKAASIGGKGATLDEKSASDLVGCDLCELLFPEAFVKLLMRIRSPQIELPNGEVVQLNMISTMGNGFTFSLMTLIITALIYAVKCRLGKTRRPMFIDWGDTAVYGDDIIVPADEAETLIHTLECAGFITNREKSFCEGPFRESCGGDYYEGYDVTPFYVKNLRNAADVYVALNQASGWCGRHKVVLPGTFTYLTSLLRERPFLVPEWLNPDQGWLTSTSPRRYKYLKGKRYQRKITGVAEDRNIRPIWMPLICGGYVEPLEGGSSAHLVYSPRTAIRRFKVRKARIPSGFLDGWDPVKRSHEESSHISLITSLFG